MKNTLGSVSRFQGFQDKLSDIDYTCQLKFDIFQIQLLISRSFLVDVISYLQFCLDFVVSFDTTEFPCSFF